MALQLRGILSILETLALDLNEDGDIQQNILSLISDTRTLSGTFSDIIANSGNNVLNKKYALMVVSNPSKVDVQNLKMALKTMQDALKTVRDSMFVFQATVHKIIEECRSRMHQHENTIKIEKEIATKLRNEIKNLEIRISDCETEARIHDESAERSEENARQLNKQAEDKRVAGIIGNGTLAGIGIVLAPYTGGLSIAVICGAAAAGNLSVILYQASQLDEIARNDRQRAAEQRSEVARHRQTKSSLERDIVVKETDVNSLEKKNDKLSTRCKKLNEIYQQLLQEISIIDTSIKYVQDFDTTLYAAEQQGDSFRIIQNAFNRNPEKLESRAQRYLSELKEKWEIVEKDLEQTQGLRSVRN